MVQNAKAALTPPPTTVATSTPTFTWEGMGEGAYVTTVDPANSTLRFRVVDYGKLGTLRGDVSRAVVGAMISLDMSTGTTGRASIDGKTACCTYALDMGTPKINP